MPSPATKPRPRSRATVFLAVASLLSFTILFWGIVAPTLDPRPEVTWRIGDDLRAAKRFTEATNGTPLALEIDLPFAAFVYVASWSAAMGTIALFPSEQLSTESENPLAAGKHQFPGLHDGTPMTWPTPNIAGPFYYLVVASRERLTDLEDALRRVRQMGHLGKLRTGFEDRGMYVFVPESGLDAAAPQDAAIAPTLEAARTAFPDPDALDGSGPMRELPTATSVFVRPFVVRGH